MLKELEETGCQAMNGRIKKLEDKKILQFGKLLYIFYISKVNRPKLIWVKKWKKKVMKD